MVYILYLCLIKVELNNIHSILKHTSSTFTLLIYISNVNHICTDSTSYIVQLVIVLLLS